MIYVILAAVLVTAFEVWFDHYRWNKNLDDKPISTIVRGVALASISIIAILYGLPIAGSILIPFAVHLFLFDQTLNITRWKTLTEMNLTYDYRIGHGLPMNKIQMAWFKVRQFLDKLCYHSDKGTDRIYSRIPWYAELFFKSLLLATSIMLFI